MVTGHVSGQAVNPRSNFFLNGQKLISGVHYRIHDNQIFNYYPSYTGHIVEFYPSGSGITSDFIADVLYAPNGSGTGIGEVQDSELTMLDVWTNSYNRYLYEITGNQTVIYNITGFSEQIWLNGIRQTANKHYTRIFDCSMNSGFVDSPNASLLVINNESGYFNIG
jgi:hypothetical protein